MVNAAYDITILSHQAYVASTDSIYVIGEVQNTGAQPQQYVRIDATFYSSNMTVVGTGYAFTELDVVHPGRKSPFRIIFNEEAIIPLVEYYQIEVSYSLITDPLPDKLRILSNSYYVGGTGSYNIVGEIENSGSGNASYVKVIATFYD